MVVNGRAASRDPAGGNPAMTTIHLARINSASFLLCQSSIMSGVVLGLLGIWRFVPVSDGTLWRALGSCGAVFIGSICASLAIHCFKANE
jgi:hypothetical protein